MEGKREEQNSVSIVFKKERSEVLRLDSKESKDFFFFFFIFIEEEGMSPHGGTEDREGTATKVGKWFEESGD